MAVEPRNLPSDDHLDEIVSILDIVRSGFARTKPEIARHTGLGRNMVTQRVNQLLAIGLIEEQGLAASSGGRNPRALRFRGDAGQVLVAHLGAMHFSAGCADLQGNITAQHREPSEIADGPKIVLDRVCDVFDRLLSQHPGDVWGIGVGLPGPVDFSSARTIAPPIMPGWDRYDVRGHLVDRFGSAVWVDRRVAVARSHRPRRPRPAEWHRWLVLSVERVALPPHHQQWSPLTAAYVDQQEVCGTSDFEIGCGYVKQVEIVGDDRSNRRNR